LPKKTSPSLPTKPAKKSKTTTPTTAKLDIIFSGPLLFVPEVIDGNIGDIDVYSPDNGHPIGAVFLPGVFFTDAELDDPQSERWPDPGSFSLLDPHSYAIHLTQQPPAKECVQLSASVIPETNHKIKPGRKLSHDWEVAISVKGQLNGWGSVRLFRVTDDLYMGADAPTAPVAAAMHRLTYLGVTAADFCGIAKQAKEYLQANISQGGSLIVMGEIPYQSTFLHERRAIDSLAKLAGLDLHLISTEPTPHKARLMFHVTVCGHSIILV